MASKKNARRMELGLIKWVDQNRGFGFIVDKGGHDVFISIHDEREMEMGHDDGIFFGGPVHERRDGYGEGEVLAVFLCYEEDSVPGKAPRACMWAIAPAWAIEALRPASAEQITGAIRNTALAVA